MPVTVKDWREDQPNNELENCVAMDSENNFKWNDVLCSATSAFICKVKPECPTGVYLLSTVNCVTISLLLFVHINNYEMNTP